jgi:hypothetical protein
LLQIKRGEIFFSGLSTQVRIEERHWFKSVEMGEADGRSRFHIIGLIGKLCGIRDRDYLSRLPNL